VVSIARMAAEQLWQAIIVEQRGGFELRTADPLNIPMQPVA